MAWSWGCIHPSLSLSRSGKTPAEGLRPAQEGALSQSFGQEILMS